MNSARRPSKGKTYENSMRREKFLSHTYELHTKLVDISIRLAEHHLRNYFSSSLMQALRTAARNLRSALDILKKNRDFWNDSQCLGQLRYKVSRKNDYFIYAILDKHELFTLKRLFWCTWNNDTANIIVCLDMGTLRRICSVIRRRYALAGTRS